MKHIKGSTIFSLNFTVSLHLGASRSNTRKSSVWYCRAGNFRQEFNFVAFVKGIFD